MNLQQKKLLSRVLFSLVAANTLLFLSSAYLQLLSTDPTAAVFIDFWGRFTVYSFWFTGFAIYVKYLSGIKTVKRFVLLIVCLNIPCFLLLAYFGKISNTPETIVFVDFWGRLTVYSLWFMCYEAYQKYVASEASTKALDQTEWRTIYE
jgi:hypothetical protein